ncbi:hypothetical protein CI109_106327 [Kwoniella shandongensis]|uniref:Uncharacterized protein n=1 Tax=Kwoniella shandongensis TaxID=1734106 RepID=A0A5M6BPC3_9TREE|nr:uncharacterized protein CI109_007081 [Kwoniella shandongensis]KAA5524593.1 hypothetical protein CI109_007081 [Kwoniella shandongensis]
MARSSRSSARPAARPSAASHPQQQQTRSASTSAYPAQQAAHPVQHAGAQTAGGRPPGLLAQAASTMGGAVAGSVVGHGISNMLFGGRSAEPAQAQAAPVDQQQQGFNQQSGVSCDIQAKDFTKCLEATNGDMQSCGYYLEALKACQAAARPY